jgi:hypothetical protein
MIGRRNPGDLPVSHVIARITLATFVALLFLTALALVVFRGGDELAFERMVAGAVKSWLIP